jgi:putative toxin-antitoxin system antitoxin component (TIGR02293 family)
MAHWHDDRDPSLEGARLARVAELLGGRKILRRYPQTPMEAHEMLLRGLPAKALTSFVEKFVTLNWDAALEKAVGMSLRTYQRHVAADDKPLSLEQTSRTWKLAEIVAKATEIFGSRDKAELWLTQPAIGLNQSRPIDLLATPAGVELVETYLERIDYGVYM